MKASNVNENESTNFAFIKKYIRLHGKGDSVYRTLVSLNIYIKLLSINCEDHQSCTWHDSTKFAGFASDVRRSFLEYFGSVDVRINALDIHECPENCGHEGRLVHHPQHRNWFNHTDRKGRVLHRVIYPRIGSFEVWFESSTYPKTQIFSRLSSGRWPSDADSLSELARKLVNNEISPPYFKGSRLPPTVSKSPLVSPSRPGSGNRKGLTNATLLDSIGDARRALDTERLALEYELSSKDQNLRAYINERLEPMEAQHDLLLNMEADLGHCRQLYEDALLRVSSVEDRLIEKEKELDIKMNQIQKDVISMVSAAVSSSIRPDWVTRGEIPSMLNERIDLNSTQVKNEISHLKEELLTVRSTTKEVMKEVEEASVKKSTLLRTEIVNEINDSVLDSICNLRGELTKKIDESLSDFSSQNKIQDAIQQVREDFDVKLQTLKRNLRLDLEETLDSRIFELTESQSALTYQKELDELERIRRVKEEEESRSKFQQEETDRIAEIAKKEKEQEFQREQEARLQELEDLRRQDFLKEQEKKKEELSTRLKRFLSILMDKQTIAMNEGALKCFVWWKTITRESNFLGVPVESYTSGSVPRHPYDKNNEAHEGDQTLNILKNIREEYSVKDNKKTEKLDETDSLLLFPQKTYWNFVDPCPSFPSRALTLFIPESIWLSKTISLDEYSISHRAQDPSKIYGLGVGSPYVVPLEGMFTRSMKWKNNHHGEKGYMTVETECFPPDRFFCRPKIFSVELHDEIKIQLQILMSDVIGNNGEIAGGAEESNETRILTMKRDMEFRKELGTNLSAPLTGVRKGIIIFRLKKWTNHNNDFKENDVIDKFDFTLQVQENSPDVTHRHSPNISPDRQKYDTVFIDNNNSTKAVSPKGE